MYKTHYPGVAQLVGRLVWDQDAASSSLATRTKNAGMAECHACIFLLKARLERSNRNMPVAYCCHQFKNWWLHLFLPLPGQKCKRVPSGVPTAQMRLQTVVLNLLLGANPTVSSYFTVYDHFRQCLYRSHSNFHKKDLLFR